MIYTAPTLYHGSTVGWLHLSGFEQPKFHFGEFSIPHPFIFLCTLRVGGESAACKAYVKVHDRYNNKPPLKKYCHDGTNYAIYRYVYEVAINVQVNVLDFHAETLDKMDMARIKQAIGRAKTSRVGRLRATCLASIYLGLEPKTWRNRLEVAFKGRRDEMVQALGQVGFDLIRNFERDDDGQQYGEVWALPISKAACATLQKPAIYKLA